MIEIIKYVPTARLRDYLLTCLSHLTPKKIKNIVKTELNFALKRKNCSSLPYHLLADATNFCQLRCPLCATGQGKHKRPSGKMDFKTFKRIIDEIGDYFLLIHFAWWGEPFLNPKILEFVNYACQRNIGTLISTNFSFPFDEKKMEGIIKSGLDILVVSLDGITPKVYNKYRVGGNFHQVVDNIKLLALSKKRFGSRLPFIEWQFLVNKYNEYQVPKLKDFAKELGVDSLVLEDLMIIFGQSNSSHINLNDWLPKNKKYRSQGYFPATEKSDNVPIGNCWWLWRSFGLSPDGGVSTCCYNNDSKLDFGNVLKSSFKDIWNNEKYQSARSLFRNERERVKTICHQCSIVRKGLLNE